MSDSDSSALHKHNKLRLLIAEDSAVDREILKAQLEKLGFFNIQEAYSGSEALHKIDISVKIGKPFHLVITDWRMPERDGLAILKFIRGQRELRDLKVIMLTGVTDQQNVMEALNEGVDDFVLKPVDAEILSKKLLKIMDKIKKAA